MLFKNDEKYTLTSDDYRKMSEIIGCGYESGKGKPPGFKDFPKGGVVIKYPKTAFTKNPDNPTRLDRPPQMIVEYEQHLETTDGTVKWNYCKRPPMVKEGQSPKYYSDGNAALMMTHHFQIRENQPDLLFFLCCISRRGAHVENVIRAAYEIENKRKDSVDRNRKRQNKVDVEAAIFHAKNKMHEKDIARIAKAMKVPNIDGMDDEEMRDALMIKIEAMEASPDKNGYSTFLEYTDTGIVGSRVDLLALIQQAKDMNLIKFHSLSNKWGAIDKNGKKIATICPLAPGRDADDSLEYHATTDEEVAAQIKQLVEDAIKEKEEAVAE